MNAQKFEFSAAAIQQRLLLLSPGERLVFDIVPGYPGSPAYEDDIDRRTVERVIERMVADGHGMVFQRRIKGHGQSTIVREFVALKPETCAKLAASLARIELPARKKESPLDSF